MCYEEKPSRVRKIKMLGLGVGEKEDALLNKVVRKGFVH